MMTEAQKEHTTREGHGGDHRTYVVHIGTLTLKYYNSPVEAARILTDAGFTPPADHVLERLKGANGSLEQAYQSTDQVELDTAHATHFRAVPKGGGRA